MARSLIDSATAQSGALGEVRLVAFGFLPTYVRWGIVSLLGVLLWVGSIVLVPPNLWSTLATFAGVGVQAFGLVMQSRRMLVVVTATDVRLFDARIRSLRTFRFKFVSKTPLDRLQLDLTRRGGSRTLTVRDGSSTLCQIKGLEMSDGQGMPAHDAALAATGVSVA